MRVFTYHHKDVRTFLLTDHRFVPPKIPVGSPLEFEEGGFATIVPQYHHRNRLTPNTGAVPVSPEEDVGVCPKGLHAKGTRHVVVRVTQRTPTAMATVSGGFGTSLRQ